MVDTPEIQLSQPRDTRGTPSDIAARHKSAVRIAGDYFQHLVAWNEALEALKSDNDVEAITIEHPDAGNVDDVVVQRQTAPNLYVQVKHAVDATTPVSHRWLMTSRSSQSPTPSLLQKFYRSWMGFPRNRGGMLLEERESYARDTTEL